MCAKPRFPQLMSPTHSDLHALQIAYDLAPILIAEYAMVDVSAVYRWLGGKTPVPTWAYELVRIKSAHRRSL